MMIKLNQSFTNYSVDKKEATRLSSKVSALLDDAMPRNIMGMLATAVEAENSIIFYNRWELEPVGKNDYRIFDKFLKDYRFEHISLFVSALHIIWHLHKASKQQASNEALIYQTDQEYFRCVENVKFYKKKAQTVNFEDLPILLSKLDDSRLRLKEIKTILSKLY